MRSLIGMEYQVPVPCPGADRFAKANGQHLGCCLSSDFMCYNHPRTEINDDTYAVFNFSDAEESEVTAPDLIGEVAGKKLSDIDFIREVFGLCQINLLGAVPDTAGPSSFISSPTICSLT